MEVKTMYMEINKLKDEMKKQGKLQTSRNDFAHQPHHIYENRD